MEKIEKNRIYDTSYGIPVSLLINFPFFHLNSPFFFTSPYPLKNHPPPSPSSPFLSDDDDCDGKKTELGGV
jgi:hypothetical protein